MRWGVGVVILSLLLACKQEQQPPTSTPKVAPGATAPPAANGPAPPAAATSVPADATPRPHPLRDELLALPRDQRGDRPRAMGLHKRAMGELRQKSLAAAEQTWAQAARADPSWDWPFYNLACIASLAGRLDDALAYLDAIHLRNPAPDMVRRVERDPDLAAVRQRPEMAPLLKHMHEQAARTAAASLSAEARAQILERAASARPGGESLEQLFPARAQPADAPVGEKLQRRIRFALRSVAKAPIALRDLISVPREDGGAEIFGLYQYSAYEECVRGHPSREEARTKCLGTRDDWDNLLRNNRACMRYGLLYARLAAAGPDAADPDAGGALTVTSVPWPELYCELRSLPHYFVADLDGDAELELFAIVTTAQRGMLDGRSPGEAPRQYETEQDNVAILSAGKASHRQAALAFSTISVDDRDDMGPGTSPADELFALQDLNGDGRLDLVQLEYRCSFEAELCRPGENLSRAIFLYAPTTDTWERLPAESTE